LFRIVSEEKFDVWKNQKVRVEKCEKSEIAQRKKRYERSEVNLWCDNFRVDVTAISAALGSRIVTLRWIIFLPYQLTKCSIYIDFTCRLYVLTHVSCL